MKFRLADLMWIMVIVAVASASVHYHLKQLETVRYLERFIDKQNTEIYIRKTRSDWFWRDGIFKNMPDQEYENYPVPTLKEIK